MAHQLTYFDLDEASSISDERWAVVCAYAKLRCVMTHTELLEKQLEQATEVREHIVAQIKETKSMNQSDHGEQISQLVNALVAVFQGEQGISIALDR